jgi:hypothetical protein
MALTCGYRGPATSRKDLPRMASNGHHAPPPSGRNRRTLLIVVAIVVALLVFGGGYALGRGNGAPEAAAPSGVPTPTTTHSRSPKPTPSESASPSGNVSATPSPDATAEPQGDTLADGRYFVRLNDVEGGESSAPAVRYDLAYFLTGPAADQAAKDRGLETPVPDGYFIVNDSHRMRVAPLADPFGVKYVPEGNCCNPVKAHNAAFLGWLGETQQSDFPPKDTSWWWITIDGGAISKIEQQFLP